MNATPSSPDVPIWQTPPAGDLPALDRVVPWSLILTTDGMLFYPVSHDRKALYGYIAYLDVSDVQMHWGEMHRLWDGQWMRMVNLPYVPYADVIGARNQRRVDARLGKIAKVEPQDVAGYLSAKEPRLIAEHRSTLDLLSRALDVPARQLGVYGSTTYKRPQRRSDFDFVVYGYGAAITAFRSIRKLLVPDGQPSKNGLVRHMQFRIPGSDLWFDPRFHAAEAYTTRLANGGYEQIGVAAIRRLSVTDSSRGIFTPARYLLEDGFILLSYRLGHAGLLRPGDRITAPALPTVRMGGHVHRVLLRYETLTIERG